MRCLQEIMLDLASRQARPFCSIGSKGGSSKSSALRECHLQMYLEKKEEIYSDWPDRPAGDRIAIARDW